MGAAQYVIYAINTGNWDTHENQNQTFAYAVSVVGFIRVFS